MCIRDRFWLIAMVFFLVVEAVTVGLVCIWFAAGSLVALLCAMFDAPVWLQIVVFLIVSAVTLYYKMCIRDSQIVLQHVLLFYALYQFLELIY